MNLYLRILRCKLWRHRGPFSLWRMWRDRGAVMCSYCIAIVSVANEGEEFTGFHPDMTPVDGPVRAFVAPLLCMLFGHETEWGKDIASLTLIESCLHCREQFRTRPWERTRRQSR